MEPIKKLRDFITSSSQSVLVTLTLLIMLLIVILLLTFRPATKKVEPEVKPTLVEVVEVKQTDQPVIISAYGSVQANRELTLRPEVSGKVIELSEHTVVGGVVKQDELLLKIDSRDYRIAVQQAKAAVEKAQLDLEIEQGRQVIAKREWEQLTPTIKTTDISESLALRKPHLEEKRAALAGAESQLEKAQLDLMRTNIRAPMNAVVTEESVELGDVLSAQSAVATLAGTDQFRVQVSIPVSKLAWIEIPTSKVTVKQEIGNGEEIQKEGRILRLLGNLDPSGRMARILVAIDDPLGLKGGMKFHEPLLLGSYVNVEIEGKTLQNVIVLRREAIRENDTVWLKDGKGKLEVRPVSIIQKFEDVVYIDQGLSGGEKVITSSIPLVLPGMELEEVE